MIMIIEIEAQSLMKDHFREILKNLYEHHRFQ